MIRIGTAKAYLTAVGAMAFLLAGCSGGQGGGGGGIPCGAPGGDWQYLSSCDSVVGGVVHQCQDTYATAAAAAGVKPSVAPLCAAFSGKLLSSPCTTANSLGSCIISASTGGLAGEFVRLVEYAGPGLTVASFEASCNRQSGKFILPDGSLPDGGLAGSAASCGSQPTDAGRSSGGVAFAIETVANGQIIECTNYVGTVTAQQLQSVVAIGAMTSSCPAQNAACACAQAAGSGTFGTTPTMVYYTTTFGGTPSTCTAAGTTCSTMYTPP